MQTLMRDDEKCQGATEVFELQQVYSVYLEDNLQ